METFLDSIGTSLPAFGSTLVLAVMVVASYTLAVALAAGGNRTLRTLHAARLAAYATVGLIGVSVVCLAYAFVSHDFRIRYVAHYSDRSMPLHYLLTALWGGQDGSLLWWLFLLSVYVGACVRWLGSRYRELQPYVIATLMAIVIFFCVVMTFAANPFAVAFSGMRADGDGLNPLLQNYWMVIHPPCLYTGFVGCSVPFAFAIAALVTGRLDHEWLVASRAWTLFAWLFLAIGNTLGMVWAYEELGWGGYWGWDPVENAAFMPLLSATAYVHSVMLQERRGLLKVWNVSLVCLTFFLTIFGTFLTRSGVISSVHSFAQSSIGAYFAVFLVILIVFAVTLVLWRWPELRDVPPEPRLRSAAVLTGWTILLVCLPGSYSIWRIALPVGWRVALIAGACGLGVFCALELLFRRMTAHLDRRSRAPHIESPWSREFTFLLNNWILCSLLFFVLVATTFPLVSEALDGESVTVGPPFYKAWVQPLGLLLLLLMGLGTLFGWRKTSASALQRVSVAPSIAAGIAAALHLLVGRTVGFPAIVLSDPLYSGFLGVPLRWFNAVTPLLGFTLCVFNGTIIIQEFVFLVHARSQRIPAVPPHQRIARMWKLLGDVFSLPHRARRRYGGYIVHLGIVLMFFGFTGLSWNSDREVSLAPGESITLHGHTLRYVGPRTEVDDNKRMIFADVDVFDGTHYAGRLSPAKFIYRKQPEMPTSEVAISHGLKEDVYLVVGTIAPGNRNVATFQVHVNPFVTWIWLGCLVLILGSVVCLWPTVAAQESRAWAGARTLAGVVASVVLGISLAATPIAGAGFSRRSDASSMAAGFARPSR
jgi:cytochrome c-type biogenesis protein CcmF